MGVFGLNRAKHQYIVGIGLTVVGVLGVIGSATGTLAPMLASLFAPQYVTPTQNTASSSTSGVEKDIQSVASGIAGAGIGGLPIPGIGNGLFGLGGAGIASKLGL